MVCNMQLNVLDDLAEAMKALDGKKPFRYTCKVCFLLKLRYFSQKRSLQQSDFRGAKHIGFLDSKKWSSQVDRYLLVSDSLCLVSSPHCGMAIKASALWGASFSGPCCACCWFLALLSRLMLPMLPSILLCFSLALLLSCCHVFLCVCGF